MMPLLFLTAWEAAILHLQNRSLLLLCVPYTTVGPPGTHGIGITTAACPAVWFNSNNCSNNNNKKYQAMLRNPMTRSHNGC